MKRLSFALAIALCMTTFVAAPAAAQESCQTPADGLTVCDENGDGEPELVRFQASQEGTGSLEIRYENSTSFFGSQRTVEATGQTADQSPAGEKETTVRLICAYDDSDVPCTALQANAWAEESFDKGAFVAASCDDVGSGATPACSIASASVDARYEDVGTRVVFICGSFGFFGPGTPCPLDLKYGVSVFTPEGDLAAFGGATPSDGSAFVCEDDPASGMHCAP